MRWLTLLAACSIAPPPAPIAPVRARYEGIAPHHAVPYWTRPAVLCRPLEAPQFTPQGWRCP